MRGTGLEVIEVGAGPSQTGPQWKQRARGSGGYESGRPNHVMAHHTAGAPSSDGWGEANYCTFGNENAPVCNLYLNRGGKVWVCAGGATNTNGSGDDPCGTTPEDSMNSHAIGIEAGNRGDGSEAWPTVQQDAYVTLCRALCDHYGIPVERVHSHFEWAPSRKIDPAGSSRYATGGDKWDMGRFRGDVVDCEPTEPIEPQPPEEEDMALSDEDIERIAEAVWRSKIDVSGHEDANIASVVGWTYGDVQKIKNATTK